MRPGTNVMFNSKPYYVVKMLEENKIIIKMGDKEILTSKYKVKVVR